MNIGILGQALITESVMVDLVTKLQIQDFFSGCEVIIGHLETTVLPAAPTAAFKDRTCHYTTSKNIAILKELGLTHLNLAGNHAFDLGPEGITETLAVLAKLGITGVGAGSDRDSACSPACVQKATEDMAIWGRDCGPQPDIVYANVAKPPLKARPGIAGLRVERMLQVDQIGADQLNRINQETGYETWSRLRADIGYDADPTRQRFFGVPFSQGAQCQDRYLIKSEDRNDLTRRLKQSQSAHHLLYLHQHHWGDDWHRSPSWILDECKSLIEAGISVVAVTGNPRAHAIYRYRGGLILSGLGGFIFHTQREARYDESVWQGHVVRVLLDKGTPQHVKIMQIEVGGLPSSKHQLRAGTIQTMAFDELPDLDNT